MPNRQFEALEQTTADLVLAAIARAREVNDRIVLRGQDLIVVATAPGEEGTDWQVETPAGDLMSSGTMPDLHYAAVPTDAALLATQSLAELESQWVRHNAGIQTASMERAALLKAIMPNIRNRAGAGLAEAAPHEAHVDGAQAGGRL